MELISIMGIQCETDGLNRRVQELEALVGKFKLA